MKAVLAAFALLGMAGTSEAVPVTYSDVDSPNTHLSFGESHVGWFNIVDPSNHSVTVDGHLYQSLPGYTIGQTILGATATFFLRDDVDPQPIPWITLPTPEVVTIFLGPLLSLDGAISPVGSSTTVEFGAGSFSLSLLENSGQLRYVVTSITGDFWLDHAILEVSAVAQPAGGPTAGVPDGGATLVLMGLGLIGLVAVQTRLTRQAA